jgi:predicted RNA-binding protein (virulence factor B family)
MKIGEMNELRILRFTSVGAYLGELDKNEDVSLEIDEDSEEESFDEEEINEEEI